MRIKEITVESLQSSMVAAKDVLDPNGRVLLAAGRLITPDLRLALQRYGIAKVYVQQQGRENQRLARVEPLVSGAARIRLMRKVRRVFRTFAAESSELDMKQLQELSYAVADELVRRSHLLLVLDDLSYVTNYLYAHSVQVGLISMALGLALGLSRQEMAILGMGGFLHDLGKLTVPVHVLNKEGKFNLEEFLQIQGHAAAGYRLLRKEQELDTRVMLIALQHHERYDGSGYPWAITGENMHRLSAIVAVADVYDALTTDRIYRKRLSIREAMAIIGSGEGRLFAPEAVQALKKLVIPYGLGETVNWSDGRRGVVAMLNSTNWALPGVRIADGWLDLLEETQVRIVHTEPGS